MRELKFRAWDKHDQCWTFFEVLDGLPMTDKGFEFHDLITLGQFTGLQDKDGVDIYEDDIIETLEIFNPNSILRGRLYVEEGAWKIWHQYGNCVLLYHTTLIKKDNKMNGSRVLGNIHQNPELLENKT
jgi:uncharacterized phage protein (TIGR01671 family)